MQKCEEANTTTNEDRTTESVPDDNDNNQFRLEQIIISKLQKIENAIDQSITKKLAENYKTIEEKITKANEYAESIKKSLSLSQGNQGQTFQDITREDQNDDHNRQDHNKNMGNKNNYAATLKKPEDFRLIMEEAKNEQIIEDREKEKTAKDFIVHGLEELGEENEEISANDVETFTKFLEVVGVSGQIDSYTRLGKQGLNKKRTLKVAMKAKNEKNDVMQNLRKLKGSSELFGKISVTDDFTNNEREQIKRWLEMQQKKASKIHKTYGASEETQKTDYD